MRGKYEHKHRPSESFIMSRVKDDNYWNKYFAEQPKKEDYELIQWFRKDSHIYVKYKHLECGTISECRLDKWNKNYIPCKSCSYKKRGELHTEKSVENYKQKSLEAYDKYVDKEEFDYEDYSYESRNLYVVTRCRNCGTICKLRASDCKNNRMRCDTCNPWASNEEIELRKYCESLGYKTEKIKRGQINQYEYDIYVPELKIAFEYNGTLWHSSKFNRITSSYHRKKVEEALKHGIRVYNLWEYWGLDMCKSIISSKLGRDKKIYARSCKVIEISPIIAKQFVDENHFEGYDHVRLNLALEYNNDIVACMTFKNKTIWELSRFCCKKYVSVIGGFSKLLNYYKKNYNYPFVTWGYRDICPNHQDFVYYKVGLKYDRYNPSILRYYNHNTNEVECRRKYQRKYQEKLFPDTFSWDLGEKENLEKQNIFALWDTGCYKFRYDPSDNI